MPPSSLSTVTTKLSTPVKRTQPAATVTDSPGNWKHPRLAEITKRQSKTIFSEKNLKSIAYNSGAFVISVVLRQLVRSNAPAGLLNSDAKKYAAWGFWLVQLGIILNIAIALLPLVRRPDPVSDIPLTPGQRKLLGLPQSSAPPTPNSVYSTPPRYSRTPSLAGSAASNRSYNSSPLSASGSPASDRRMSGSPYSPAAASPLFQKAMAGGIGGARRSSFGSSGPLGASTATSLFADGPNTPSPAPGKRASVGLNNKWLYEKGRRTSNNTFMR